MTLEPIRIDDPDDPRLAAYRDVRERDLKGREGLFIAEGKVVLAAMLAAARFQPDSALVLENRLAGIAGLLSAFPPGAPVYVASRTVMDRSVGFHIHRGILAAGRRGAGLAAGELLAGLPERALAIAIVGVSNHDNMGAIFRNAAAFEADAVILDDACCDPLYRKAIRVSVGAALKVPYARVGTANVLVSELVRHGFEPLALSPHGEQEIATLARPKRAALLLGSEGGGLPREVMARVRTVRIAMSPSFDSLNVATAAAIALHRLWRG